MNTVATKRIQHLRQRTAMSLPYHFWVGIALIACWWPIAWIQIQPFSDNYFFPLWLGYILTVDGLVVRHTETSLIARSGWRFLYLFILSVPLWWIFEGFNQILNNWMYHLPEQYSDAGYTLRASLAFSTVVPAVMVTTELVRASRFNPLRKLPALIQGPGTLLRLHLLGWLMLIAVFTFPDRAFPLVWLALFFLIDPVATYFGGRSVGSFLRNGDWSPVFNIAVGTVICGFFWELWNYYALPRWTYSIPFADVLHVFEMPLLGYGGYIPFGLEIFAFYALIAALLPRLRLPGTKVSSIESN
jgi:hypothetical protein